jgi:hypothetical protein
MVERKPNYGRMASDAFGYYLVKYPDKFHDVPTQYQDQLWQAIDDLDEALKGVRNAVRDNQGEQSELVGVTNSLCCAHDVLSIFKEAGVAPPKIFTEIYRTLEKRRGDLDPGQSKGHHP